MFQSIALSFSSQGSHWPWKRLSGSKDNPIFPFLFRSLEREHYERESQGKLRMSRASESRDASYHQDLLILYNFSIYFIFVNEEEMITSKLKKRQNNCLLVYNHFQFLHLQKNKIRKINKEKIMMIENSL